MSQHTSVHTLLYTDRVHGRTIGFWYVTEASPLRETPQRLIAADPAHLPAHDGFDHWCGFLKEVPGYPDYDVGTKHWQPGIYSPSPTTMQAELLVATLRPEGCTDSILAETERGIAYAALLPHSLHQRFDPSVPNEVALLGPWLELGMDTEWGSSPAFSSMMGRLPRERAKCLGLDYLYLAEPMPDNRRLRKTWRTSSCSAEAVLGYCREISTADGSPRRDLAVYKIPLAGITPSAYWNKIN